MDVALESAIDIAKKFESELILLHVLPEGSSNERLKDLVNEKMEQFATKIKTHQIVCSFEIISGNSVDTILKTAERKRVNLILLGAGKSRKLEFKLGSNSEKIIRDSAVPVWVIEKDKSFLTDTILCPVDFSEESKVALDNAIHLCRRYESKLIILHATKSFGKKYIYLGVDLGNEQSDALKGISKRFDEFLQEINLIGVNWEKELALGHPAAEIIKSISANDVGLVVMGSTGKTGLKRFFIGSVTEKVTQKVPCSFIISKSESLIHLKLDESLSNIDELYQEGLQLAKDGYNKEAIAVWEKCTDINELYLKAWGAIASTYESMGESEKAITYSNTKKRILQSIWDEQVEVDLKGKHNLYK